MKDLYLVHLADQADAAVEEVRDHYAAVARELRREIQAGTLTREEAIARLTDPPRITRVGAAVIIDRY